MVAQITTRLDAAGDGYISQFTLGAGASKAAAVNTNDAETTYIHDSPVANHTQFFDIDEAFVEKFAFVSAVRVAIRMRYETTAVGGVTPYVRIYETSVAGTTWTQAQIGTTYGDALVTADLTRPTGGTWTDADFRLTGLDRFQFGCFVGSESINLRVTEMYAEVDNIPLATVISMEREIASRRLRAQREPEEIINLVNGWEALQAELMDPIGFSHVYGPTHDGLGWSLGDWERGFGRLRKQKISLSMSKVNSKIVNRRRYQTTYWETSKLTLTNDADIATGLARLDSCGAEREFSRTSKAWIENIGGTVVKIDESKEKIELSGLLIEESRTNLIRESSFVNGTTGWTKGETTGTATFATEADNLLFDSTVSATSVKLTATAASHIVDIHQTTVTALAASTIYTFSVDWATSGTGGPATTGVAIKNTSTGNWLQTGGTWSGSRDNIALGTEFSGLHRDFLVFTSESTSATHEIYVNFINITNGAIHRIYHVQLEAGAWMSSRIVTETSDGTRTIDDLLITNYSSLAQRIWEVDKFTIKIVATPQFNTADLTGTNVLINLFHDTDNYISIETTSSLISAVYKHAGTTETASFSSPGLVANTEFTVVARKVGPSGELNETSGAWTIFLDGVKGGTEDNVGTDLTESATSFMQIGSYGDNTAPFNGWIAEIMVSPIVFSDTEISGGLP